MKTKILLLLLLIMASFVGVGCSNGKTAAAPPATDTPIVPTPIDPGGPGGGGTGGGLTTADGDVVDFIPVDFETFNAWYGKTPLNSPKNFKISVNLKPVNETTFKYYGKINISYEDNGQTFMAILESGSGTNVEIKGSDTNGLLESVYNYWYLGKDKQTVFSGFYQDHLGSIVFVVDKTVDQGDGQGAAYVSGSVYFKNFSQSFATQSTQRKCWFINGDPYGGTIYDCRSPTIIGKSDLYPTTGEGYRKLGTFSGLSKVKAFNIK